MTCYVCANPTCIDECQPKMKEIKMNERIEKLAEQSYVEVTITRSSRGVLRDITAKEFSREKFAELIIRECVGVIEGGSFLHDDAPDAKFARDCSNAVKQHFAVKE